MASFQSKIGWKRPRKTETKNHRSVLFLPGAKQQIKKKQQKKIPKTKKHRYGFISSQNRLENMRWRENKNYCSVPFLSDEKQKIPKQQQKNSKN